MNLSGEARHGRVVYVGDEPIPQKRWVDEFSLAICGRHVHVVPIFLMRGICMLGDVLARLGV